MEINKQVRCFMRILKVLLDSDRNYLLPIKEYKMYAVPKICWDIMTGIMFILFQALWSECAILF